MRTLLRLTTAFALAGLFTACEDQLVVSNLNAPERDRVLATPADAEAFLGGAYRTAHNAMLGGSNDGLQPQLLVMGMESYSGNANFGMNLRSGLPRNQIDNSRGNPTAAGNFRDWNVLSRSARIATLVLDRLYSPGYTFGSPSRDARGRAFGWFSHGVAVGHLALAYDSVGRMMPGDDPEEIVPLISYDEAAALAIVSLDSAITIANSATGSAGFPIPGTWFGGADVSVDQFTRLARSYKARIRANVARNPAERTAVNWNAVIADANAGISADFSITSTAGSTGWDVVWPIQHYLFQSWHQGWSFMLGMGDTSGNYEAWLAQPPSAKASFVIVTPDLRFPQGATRDAQRASQPAAPANYGRPYWRNRPPGDDVVSAEPWANSLYDHYRFQTFYPSRQGQWPVLVRAETQLLAAEGYIRTGQIPLAVPIINTYRTSAGLPALPADIGANDPVPGGAACVPRVPQGQFPGPYTGTVCGNVMEALKWEYRMETALTSYGNWFFPGRGWGDLPRGTPVHFPVPYQEMDTRSAPAYNLGGAGNPGGAAVGTYGL